jgi:hypothetical protein
MIVRFVSAALAFMACHLPASAQEQGTIHMIVREETGRAMFVFKSASSSNDCSSIDMSSTTPEKAKVLKQLIFAETLIHKSRVGYVYMLANPNGPIEVMFSYYIWRLCALDEKQLYRQAFQGDDAFARARNYYHRLVIRLSK